MDIRVEVPSKGRSKRATVTVFTDAGKLLLTDRACLESIEGRRKLAQGLADRLAHKRASAKKRATLAADLEKAIETKWAAIIESRRARETEKEAGELTVFDRLERFLDKAPASRLYGDADLMTELARVEANPEDQAGRSAIREILREHKATVREYERAVAKFVRKLRAEEPEAAPPPRNPLPYRETPAGLVYDKPTVGGSVEVPLTNFAARIVGDVAHDDGAEVKRHFEIEASLRGKAFRFTVPADRFAAMNWPTEQMGATAMHYAGPSIRDHARCAVQGLSGDVPVRLVYRHTGWRLIGDVWHFLHAGGAVGPSGLAADVPVVLPPALAGFLLPEPPTGQKLVEDVKAVLRLLDGLDGRGKSYTLAAAAFRSAIGCTDFAIHLWGQTGSYKTELAALAQQFFGAGMTARNLPCSWSSTGNALEYVAFHAKDVLLVIDDFCPVGSIADVQRYNKEADRFFRAQGNRSGRQRLTADISLQAGKPPRGLAFSTGEDLPRNQSARARLFVMELSRKDVDLARLTECQRDAAAGRYAAVMSAYLKWLAPHYEAVQDRLPRERAALRDELHAEGHHARTPGIVADLLLGFSYFVNFAEDAGALTAGQGAELLDRAKNGLLEVAGEQAGHIAAAECTGQFLRLLAAAISSGRAHVAAPKGGDPEFSPGSWGWRHVARGGGQSPGWDWEPQGQRVGWVDGKGLYLEPEASFAEAQEMARRQGESVPVSPRTLHKRLKERGLLVRCDEGRDRLTVRMTLEGEHHAVLFIKPDALAPPETVQTGQTGQTVPEAREKMAGRVGRFSGNGEKPSNGTGHKTGAAAENGRFGRSETGGDTRPDANGATHLNGTPAPADSEVIE